MTRAALLWMRIRLVPTLVLVAVFITACAPASTPDTPPAAATQPPTVVSPTETSAALEPTIVPSAVGPIALPVATSRGPNLEATDPTTVSLASGGLQFVEFFEFW